IACLEWEGTQSVRTCVPTRSVGTRGNPVTEELRNLSATLSRLPWLTIRDHSQHLVRIGEKQTRTTNIDQALHLVRRMQRRGEQFLDAIVRQGAQQIDPRLRCGGGPAEDGDQFDRLLIMQLPQDLARIVGTAQ